MSAGCVCLLCVYCVSTVCLLCVYCVSPCVAVCLLCVYCVCLTLGFSVNACLCQCVSLSMRASVNCVSLTASLSLCLSHCVSLTASLTVPLSLPLSRCLSHCVSHGASRSPPQPASVVIRTIEQETGQSMHELFSEFDEIPLGSASIGQVIDFGDCQYQNRIRRLSIAMDAENLENLTQFMKLPLFSIGSTF